MKSFHLALDNEEKHDFPPEMFNRLEKTDYGASGFTKLNEKFRSGTSGDRCS